ncbi:MAG: LuxR C-terminal-related transcriptional regulator [Coriobacteriales bacterium]|nr:LuxR C-terminal-related transcriptional regulator [Coriobacteriales bacterium]
MMRTIWVQLSANDNMLSHFWETFSQAFAPLNPDLAQMLLSVGFPETMELQRYLGELLIAELKPRYSYALVFDDLHLLEDGPTLNFIAQICLSSTEKVSVIIISRRDNLPNVNDLYYNKRLSRIDEEELFFTKSEMADYFELIGIKISNELTTSIYFDTEGWPFAVSLAANLLEKNPDNGHYIHSALTSSFEVIADNELFSVISDKLRHFLIQLSLIKHLSPDLISEFKDGQQSMNELVRISSLIRYDNYMHVYRIHHLLLHYLEKRQDILTKNERYEANKKAARWCGANGYKLDALSYYHAVGDYGAIIDIACSYPPVIPFDVASTVLAIFQDAPVEMFDQHSRARALHTRLILSVGKIGEAQEKTREYLAQLEARSLDGTTSHILMGLHNNLGFAKLITCPETRDYSFAQHFEKALEYFDTSTKLPHGGLHFCPVGPYALRVGGGDAKDVEDYIEALNRSVPCATLTLQGCAHGLDDLVRSECAFFRGQSVEAEHHALNCISAAREYDQFELVSRALFLLIRIYLQRGKYSQLVAAHTQLETLTNEPSFANRHILYEMISSWFFAMIGEINRVDSWLKSDLWSTDAKNLFDGLDDSIKTKCYLANKNYQTLLDFSNSRTARYGISRYILGKVGIEAAKAVCHCQLGERTAALQHLEMAYELSEPNRFDMMFIELGNNMRTLTNMALKAKEVHVPSSWLKTIRSKATTYAKRVAHIRSCYLAAHDLETNVQLTGKELEILTDLSQGLSRTEISLAHGISINTVKTMLQMIYEKLGAENAIDAVRIAATKQLI